MIEEKEFLILAILEQQQCTSPIEAITIERVITSANDSALSCYSTVHKNLEKLVSRGYVKHGITSRRSYTYFLSKNGLRYLEEA